MGEKYIASSSFYFMAEKPGDQDYNYPIEDCEAIVGELSDGGRGVGLHGCHASCQKPMGMKERKQQLEKVPDKSVSRKPSNGGF